MNIDKRLLELVPFNFYEQDLPDELSPGMIAYFRFLRNYMQGSNLSIISSLVATNYRGRKPNSSPISVVINTFGSFRKPYRAIKAVARSLAPLYYEIQILPIIVPLTQREWVCQVQYDGSSYLRVRKSGIMVYSVEEEN